LRGACTAAGIDREPRSWERPSDHAPIWLELDLADAAMNIAATKKPGSRRAFSIP